MRKSQRTADCTQPTTSLVLSPPLGRGQLAAPFITTSDVLTPVTSFMSQGTSSRSARASGGRSSNTSTGSGSSPASSCGAGSDDQMSPLLMMAVEAERRLSLPGGREAPQPPTLLPPAAAAAMMMPPPPLPPFMMPPPHMAMFAGPGGAPFFAPVFFAPPGYGNQGEHAWDAFFLIICHSSLMLTLLPLAVCAAGMMLPMLPMGPPLAAVAGPRGKAPVKEGGADSFRSEEAAAALAAHLAALCNAFKPAARPARREDDGLFGRLGCFEAAAEPTTTAAQHGCHIALRASACSAFRPAARQLASA